MFPINPDYIPTHRLQRAIDTLKGSMDKLEKVIAPDASAKLPPVRPTPAPEQAAAASKITSDILAMLDSNPDPERDLSTPEIQMRAMKVAKYLDNCDVLNNINKGFAVQIMFIASAMHFLKHNTVLTPEMKQSLFDDGAFMTMGDNAAGAAGMTMEKTLAKMGLIVDAFPEGFNPATDPDRPVVGDKLEHANKTYIIADYSCYLLSDLFKAKSEEEADAILDCKGYDASVCRNHSSIRGVMWQVYLTEEK